MGFKKPGFVTGVRQEAKLVPPVFPVLCSGANAKAAYAAARQLAQSGCDLLVSFGLAGALDPDLKPGTLLLPQSVIAPDGAVYACQPFGLAGAVTLPLAGSDELVASVKAKAALFAKTKAASVDMESHEVARAAQEANLPFLVLRAVSDAASEALPEFLAAATAPDGSTRLLAILAGIAKSPGRLPSLFRLARASNLAFASLRQALTLLLVKK